MNEIVILYSLVIMYDDKIYVFRDLFGNRFFCFGKFLFVGLIKGR